jgi:hypothetical protein
VVPSNDEPNAFLVDLGPLVTCAFTAIPASLLHPEFADRMVSGSATRSGCVCVASGLRLHTLRPRTGSIR